MIREIIQFVHHLEREYPEAFTLNKAPSPGLHLWVELDENGIWKNTPPQPNKDYIVYKRKNAPEGMDFKAIEYEELGARIGNNMNKVLDKRKQIFSCSPFLISYKLKTYTNDKIEGDGHEKITGLLDFYFENSFTFCLPDDDEVLKQRVIAFKNNIPNVLKEIENIPIETQNKEGETISKPLPETLKGDDYINIYYKNIPLEKYTEAHNNYLKAKLFNTDNYNTEANNTTFGLSNFLNGANSKKAFLEHKTASMHKGISGRITAQDAVALNKFDVLQSNRVLPNPLPLFVDKEEFKTNREIIRIFNTEEGRKFSYARLLKALYDQDNQRVLGNYYLLNISRGVVNDFDFVSNFLYKLEGCHIFNLFELKQKKELLPANKLNNIFGFENYIVKTIFNNGLVRETKNGITYNYYNDIDPNYISGGDIIANLILKYRKAFYDYIYKSRRQSITHIMFDDIMLHSVIADLKSDEVKDNRHTREYPIKEKLNIWFSLYNYFDSPTLKTRINMANKFEELLKKMESVANNDSENFSDDVPEFLFGAGQVIYFLLSRSKASNPSHALLEPFLQKASAGQLQTAIGNAINAYKHDIRFGKGRFERLSAKILCFETKENLKNYQHYLLTGYFAPAVIYSKKEEVEEVSNN